MRATIFEPLLELYKLRYPSKKSLPNKIIPKAETLALSFYSHVFSQVFGINWPVCCLPSRLATGESVRQAYTNLFYSLGHANQAALDFIACLICLLSQPIFSCQECQTSQKVQKFMQNLQNSHIKLRQHLFIVYTQETIGYKISKQSATMLFSHYIVSELNCFSNLGTKIRVNLQLKEVQANIQKKGEEVDIRPRMKKRTKYQEQSKINYREEIKSIMRNNQIQIQQQAKMNKKFQKFINKCITEGQNEVSEALYKKSPSVIKLSAFLNTIKNCNTFISKLKKKAEINHQNQRSFQHWKKVVHDMKNLSYLTRKQVISALSVSQMERSIQIKPQFHLPTSQSAQVTRRPASKAMIEVPHQRSMHAKKTIPRYENLLPNLKDFSQANKSIIVQPCIEERPIKLIYQNSRKLKRELSEFVNERKSRQLQ